ncbi:putative MarR family transcriptional regulator [Actinacidiphila reveromycinica]|uniref:Putative MarR family transcriptional regulator n=1 Tax=Actinacidiphila reveromycinica TaxID=659352 RepID=A0A7U3UV60_9ACTN|nr:MarR family transcriptional regulator [Streptomyces sp. SN-593]BBA99452.1 putative MarR family transcriptional regulator [Streptomyces sp. SN-593]
MDEISGGAGGAGDGSAVRAAEQVWVVVGRLRRRLREVNGDGLTPAQSSVLVRLAKGEGASISGLAAIERVRPQSMAKIVAGLEEAGLVSRRPDPDDGRRQLLALTERGVERRLGDRRSRQEWLVRELRTRYTEEQRQTIIDAMALLDEVAQS